VIGFLRRYVALHADLLDDVERELAGDGATALSRRL
jgi:hypothetical protein